MIQANYGAGAVVNKNLSATVGVAGATMEAVPASSERILVIEDDRAVQKALKRLFEGEGFAVDIAGNGAAGLEMFRAAAPSVLVLDLSLPGTPGQDICREISQAAPSLPGATAQACFWPSQNPTWQGSLPPGHAFAEPPVHPPATQ